MKCGLRLTAASPKSPEPSTWISPSPAGSGLGGLSANPEPQRTKNVRAGGAGSLCSTRSCQEGGGGGELIQIRGRSSQANGG